MAKASTQFIEHQDNCSSVSAVLFDRESAIFEMPESPREFSLSCKVAMQLFWRSMSATAPDAEIKFDPMLQLLQCQSEKKHIKQYKENQ